VDAGRPRRADIIQIHDRASSLSPDSRHSRRATSRGGRPIRAAGLSDPRRATL